MKKERNKGVLTVEASIVLTALLLFILFLFSFGRVYRAQNLVSHAALQAADAVALESYLRETAFKGSAADVAHLASGIANSGAISAESLKSLRAADLPKVVREKFITAIANSEDKADQKLKAMGVKDGLDGVDFSACKVDLTNDDVIVLLTYTIKMQYPVFGGDEITVTKAAKAKTFGEILFEVSTEPNNPNWGATEGDTKVTHGSTVVIRAIPKYGYKFVKWNDGNTNNPRTVTVTDAQHYVAIFERDKFGMNLSAKIQYDKSVAGMTHTDYGTVSGQGEYLYLDEAVITATPRANYEFVSWDDGNTDNPRTVKIDKIYHYTAIFEPKTYTVSVGVNDSAMGAVRVSQGSQSGESIRVQYGSKVRLLASSKDSILYSFIKWNDGGTRATREELVTGNVEYRANFKKNTHTVMFYVDGVYYHTTEVLHGSTIEGSGAEWPSEPTKDGAWFGGWKTLSPARLEYESFSRWETHVYEDITLYASWGSQVTLGANAGDFIEEGRKSGTKSETVTQGDAFNFSQCAVPVRDGFSFDGWFVGDTQYSGSVTIYSHITVYAKWKCKHRYDNGVSMYVPDSEAVDNGCKKTVVNYICSGCGDSYQIRGTGTCVFDAQCGSVHSASHWGSKNDIWTCDKSSHAWKQGFACRTCVYCGTPAAAAVCKVSWCKQYHQTNLYQGGEFIGYWCVEHMDPDREVKYNEAHGIQ